MQTNKKKCVALLVAVRSSEVCASTPSSSCVIEINALNELDTNMNCQKLMDQQITLSKRGFHSHYSGEFL